jgi:serine/threonine-protein kinase
VAGDQGLNGRTDLYSLACVLYEALAGVPAFLGATPHAVLAQRLTHQPRSIRVYRPSVTEALQAVLTKALATAPADRYQTANEFSDALARALGEPLAEFRAAFGQVSTMGRFRP